MRKSGKLTFYQENKIVGGRGFRQQGKVKNKFQIDLRHQQFQIKVRIITLDLYQGKTTLPPTLQRETLGQRGTWFESVVTVRVSVPLTPRHFRFDTKSRRIRFMLLRQK